jgi:hypothetical protein
MNEEQKTEIVDLKLLTREQVSATLAPTEQLEFITLKPGQENKVVFSGEKDHPILEIGDRQLQMDDKALTSVASSIGLQKGYVKKSPMHVLLPALNYWYGEGLNQPIRAIVSDDVLLRTTTDRVKSLPVSNERLLVAAENVIGKDNVAGYHKISSTLDFTTMSLVTNKSFQPINKDTLFGGVQIRNSILGKKTVEVSPYIFRQWCTNGAISSESVGRYTRKRRGGGDDIDDWMTEIIGSASNALDREFERIRHLTTVSVTGHLGEVLDGIQKDHSIPKNTMNDIRDEATSSNAQTMYDVWNAITRVATHSDSMTPLSAIKLQGIAGHVTKQNEFCTSCYRTIN